MGLDVAKFRAEAKAAGYLDSDIDEALGITAAPAASAPPPSPATESANAATAQNDADFAKKAKEEEEKFNEKIKNPSSFPVQLGDFKADVTPAGLIAGGAIGLTSLYGGYKATEKAAGAVGSAANKVYDSLRQKMAEGKQAAPTFAQELAGEEAFTPTQSSTPQGQKTFAEANAEYQQLKKQADVLEQERIAAKNALNPTEAVDVGNPPKDMPLVEQAKRNAAINKQTEATKAESKVKTFTKDASGNIQWPEGMSAAAKRNAEAFAAQYPDLAKQLEVNGKFGILGAGAGDNNLYNSWGSKVMKEIRKEVNAGEMVGSYGNYETKINPAVKAIPPNTPLGQQLGFIRATNPQGGTYGTLGVPATIADNELRTGKNLVPKLVKAGGPALLLMSIADAAKAAQQGKYGEAAMRTADVATDYIPGVGQVKQALTPTEAGAPVVPPERYQEASKLGSPYYLTDWAKTQRSKAVPPPR